jgi:hypothetical protein
MKCSIDKTITKQRRQILPHPDQEIDMHFTTAPLGGTYYRTLSGADAAGVRSPRRYQSGWRIERLRAIAGRAQRTWVAETSA